jgi:hypothetical protein
MDNSVFQNFQTKRQEMLSAYAKAGTQFLATTRGLHSVGSIAFTPRNEDLTLGNIAFAVAAAGQEINFFAYGANSLISLSGNPQHRATEADTNLVKAFETPANSDLSIEWLSASARAIKCQYATAGQAKFVAAPAGETQQILDGQISVIDPFGIFTPAAVGASATLQHVAFHALAPFLTCRAEWDNADRTEKIGTFDQFTQGGGASYLNSNGEPSVMNRFRMPEGLLWARSGQPAGQLVVKARLESPVAIAYNPVAAPVDGTFNALTAIHLEITFRAGGLLLRVPGSN